MDTIKQAAYKALEILEKPSHVEEIFDVIVNNRFYNFGAAVPLNVIGTELLRSCVGVKISKQTKTKFFNKVAPMTFGLISWKKGIQQYPEEIFNLDVELVKFSHDIGIEDMPVVKLKKGIKSSDSYKRDKYTSKRAIVLANYKCEVDNNHIYFTSRVTGENYVEAHHLIPMEYQDCLMSV
jgi:hypothetical protein